MGKVEGYLNSSSLAQSDECLTPRYAVEPIVKYLKAKKFKTIWCPFDKEDSQFVRVLQREGFDVHYTHKDDSFSSDFFECACHIGLDGVIDCMGDPIKIDCIVSNPPFSLKDKILKELYDCEVPFMVLLPQNALQSKARVSMFMEKGLEYLAFDSRICYYTNKHTVEEKYDAGTRSYYEERVYLDETDFTAFKKSNHFASGYFCHGVLPESLIFEKLETVQEHYHKGYVEKSESVTICENDEHTVSS